MQRIGHVLTHLQAASSPGTSIKPAAPGTPRQNEDGSASEFDSLTLEQRYEFDVRGYFVMKGHYSAKQVATFHAGIDELQALPVTHEAYTSRGLSPPGGFSLAAAADPADTKHWHGRSLTDLIAAGEGTNNRIDMLICGTDKFDAIVRDKKMKAIHSELAGGRVMLSNNYYIEKHGPCEGGGLHHGGYPRMRNFHYGFDHTVSKFDCFSTKATLILSDMSTIDKGPFAVIPGSHKANFDGKTHLGNLSDASKVRLAEPVFAEAGDVVIFTEGITHNAYPVLDHSRRRSLFFNWVPAIDRDNLPHRAQRMSIYPAAVLDRLQDEEDQLTAPGYI